MKLRLILSAFLIAFTTQAQQIEVSKANRTIAVNTSDSATADADSALVHIGFITYAADAPSAYSAGSKTSNAIAKALADAGIEKKSIQSDDQSVGPVEQFENNQVPDAQRAQRKFKVTQSWTVKTKSDDAAKILNIAVLAGANSSGNIEWTVADPNALEAEAASHALTRARAIAEQMAKALDTKLVNLIYASNQAPDQDVRPLIKDKAVRVFKNDGPPPPAPLAINPRKVERSATVYAVFSIE